MSVLVGKDSIVITQGITGKSGLFHSQQCREYGTKLVGGVTPGRGGQSVDNFPVWDSCSEAVQKCGANVSMIFVPPPAAADAIVEVSLAGDAASFGDGTKGVQLVPMSGGRASIRIRAGAASEQIQLGVTGARSARGEVSLEPVSPLSVKVEP